MSGYGTRLPIGVVRFRGEFWRVSGPSTDIENPAQVTPTRHKQPDSESP